MRILLLSDGVPGHVNQAKGLIQHLSEIVYEANIQIDEKVITLKYRWMRILLRVILNNELARLYFIIRFAYGNPGINGTYDLIISAGGNTSFLNAELAKNLNIHNIFIGSLRKLKASLFTVVMTLEPVNVGNNIIMPFAPCLTTLKSTREAAKKYFGKDEDEKIWLMIIGGNGARCEYTEDDWQLIADAMKYFSEQFNIKWLLTTSRRTGLENEKLLKTKIPSDILEAAVWYNHHPEKVMQAFLGRASLVFCTVDSMSMLTESISSCSQTIAILPGKHHMTKRYMNALDNLKSEQLLSLITIEDLKTSINTDCMYLYNNALMKDKVSQSYQVLAEELRKYPLFLGE